MAEARQTAHRPIQTSAVIVLGKEQGPAIPPPSPPTPCVSPSDSDSVLSELSEPFSLEQKRGGRPEGATQYRLQRQVNSQKSRPSVESRLRLGLHVLNTEAEALENLARLYDTDSTARHGFDRAVETIQRQGRAGGKLVIIGVGKSGHIGKKLVATMQSLDIRAVFLHPTEALHGDLGVIDKHDTLMFITYSGKTQELMLLLPHLNETLPTILLTSHIRHETCELMKRRPDTILLPAPIPQSEKASFGVSAPSTSTTVALALGDALAITAANEMHHDVAAAFAKNHPGGAIGAAATAAAKSPQTLNHLCELMHNIPSLQEAGLTLRKSLGLDLLRAGVDSKSGWMKAADDKLVVPSKIRRISSAGLTRPLAELEDVFVSRDDMLDMSADTTVRQACDMVRASQLDHLSDVSCRPDVVIGVTEGGKIIGVLEASKLFEAHGS